jgi:excisionase family DNA binding protein
VSPSSQIVDSVIKPDPAEAAGMEALRDQLNQAFEHGYRPVLMGPDGEHVELTEAAFQALMFVARGMAEGMTMTLVPTGQQLTTQQAAEMLHVSRPHLIKMLDRGDLPYEKVGTHRRLAIEDVLAYREQRSMRRREQLDDLTRLSQELEGGYS